MTLSVRDVHSNFEENLQRWARTLGVGAIRRAIFLTIYSNKKEVWSVPEIAQKTGLDTKTVASNGRQMCVGGLFEQVDGTRVSYRKIAEVHHAKKKIIILADHKKKREALPTKRNAGSKGVINMSNVTNKFSNVGVANTGEMSGSISGNSQHIQLNESAKTLVAAFENFKRELTKDPALTEDQREDAISATTDLELELKKPESGWDMSKVRNAVAALKTLSAGTEAVHKLYERLHPLIASHFHLLS